MVSKHVTGRGTELRLCPPNIDENVFAAQAERNGLIYVLIVDDAGNVSDTTWSVTNWKPSTKLWGNIRTHHYKKACEKGVTLRQVFYSLTWEDLPNIRNWKGL